jgi:hypothetical protein
MRTFGSYFFKKGDMLPSFWATLETLSSTSANWEVLRRWKFGNLKEMPVHRILCCTQGSPLCVAISLLENSIPFSLHWAIAVVCEYVCWIRKSDPFTPNNSSYRFIKYHLWSFLLFRNETHCQMLFTLDLSQKAEKWLSDLVWQINKQA